MLQKERLKTTERLKKIGEVGMSNLEHLIEKGLCRLDEGKSYREWREIMQQDINWEGNENITIDNLWEICQYVYYVWTEELKKHNAVKPDTDSEGTVSCGNCGTIVGYYPAGCRVPEKLCRFCPECGQEVEWE